MNRKIIILKQKKLEIIISNKSSNKKYWFNSKYFDIGEGKSHKYLLKILPSVIQLRRKINKLQQEGLNLLISNPDFTIEYIGSGNKSTSIITSIESDNQTGYGIQLDPPRQRQLKKIPTHWRKIFETAEILFGQINYLENIAKIFEREINELKLNHLSDREMFLSDILFLIQLTRWGMLDGKKEHKEDLYKETNCTYPDYTQYNLLIEKIYQYFEKSEIHNAILSTFIGHKSRITGKIWDSFSYLQKSGWYGEYKPFFHAAFSGSIIENSWLASNDIWKFIEEAGYSLPSKDRFFKDTADNESYCHKKNYRFFSEGYITPLFLDIDFLKIIDLKDSVLTKKIIDFLIVRSKEYGPICKIEKKDKPEGMETQWFEFFRVQLNYLGIIKEYYPQIAKFLQKNISTSSYNILNLFQLRKPLLKSIPKIDFSIRDGKSNELRAEHKYGRHNQITSAFNILYVNKNFLIYQFISKEGILKTKKIKF